MRRIVNCWLAASLAAGLVGCGGHKDVVPTTNLNKTPAKGQIQGPQRKGSKANPATPTSDTKRPSSAE